MIDEATLLVRDGGADIGDDDRLPVDTGGDGSPSTSRYRSSSSSESEISGRASYASMPNGTDAARCGRGVDVAAAAKYRGDRSTPC